MSNEWFVSSPSDRWAFRVRGPLTGLLAEILFAWGWLPRSLR